MNDIKWVENNTDQMMSQTLQQVQQQTEQIVLLAKDAQLKGQLIGQYYQSLGEIEQAQIEANSQGVASLSAVQAKRFKYTQTKQKLLKAVRG